MAKVMKLKKRNQTKKPKPSKHQPNSRNKYSIGGEKNDFLVFQHYTYL